MIYRRVMKLVADLEARQIAPLREKVDAILVDVKTVTARVSQQTERVDHAISGTIHRVDETADHIKGSVREKVNQAVGVIRGIRAVITSLMNGGSSAARSRRIWPFTGRTGGATPGAKPVSPADQQPEGADAQRGRLPAHDLAVARRGGHPWRRTRTDGSAPTSSLERVSVTSSKPASVWRA